MRPSDQNPVLPIDLGKRESEEWGRFKEYLFVHSWLEEAQSRSRRSIRYRNVALAGLTVGNILCPIINDWRLSSRFGPMADTTHERCMASPHLGGYNR